MKHLFLITLLSFSTFLSAQSDAEAIEAIKGLKTGTLVVNLIYPQKKIDKLLEEGNKTAAIAIQSEVKREHLALMLAFTNNYTFGKVLFIYSYDIGRFTEGDPTALFNLEGIEESTLPAHYFYVELSQTQSRSLTGFVVKKPNRDQLTKPFPYFISQYEFLNLKKRTFVEMVKQLDAKFSAYYNKAL